MTSINGFHRPQQVLPESVPAQPEPARKVPSLLGPLVMTAFWILLAAIMVWSSHSIITLTHAVHVSYWLAWIPAVATDGAMLVATAWAVNEHLDRNIRQYAGCIAFTGISGSVTVACIQHYLLAGGITPSPELAALIGGIPSLMAALLVHVYAMIRAQQRRMQQELETAHADLNTAAGVLAEAKRVIGEADSLRREAHERGLREDASNRRARHEAEVTDLRRLQQERDRTATEDATRSLQVVQQGRDEVATARATAAEELQALDVEREQVRQARREVDTEIDAAGQARERLAEEKECLADEERELERLRGRQRRRNNAAAERPPSHPVLQQDPAAPRPVSHPPLQQRPAVSQPSSQTASRDERREWARQQIVSGEWEREHGRELRGADIDRQFGGPRTGAAILREIDAAVRAELEAITSGG